MNNRDEEDKDVEEDAKSEIKISYVPSIELIAKKYKLAFEEQIPTQINASTLQAMLAKVGSNEKSLKVPVDYASLSV